MRVALVHDWLVTMGGAERVLEELAAMFPEAPIYTGVVNRRQLTPSLAKHTIHTTFVQRWPKAIRWYNRYLPLLMYGFEQFDLSAYDLVISSSAAVAKGILTPTETRHLAYVHTPMRYAWDLYHTYREQEARGLSRWLMGPTFHYMRLWDRLASDRVDMLLANSNIVRRRILKHYGRPARVVPPPVDVDLFHPNTRPGQYFLVLSRLVPYKRIDIAVQAANQLGVPLVVAGDGVDRPRLEKLAGPTVQFLGRVDNPTRIALLEGAHALVFPGEEDFGIVPVEAQAAGRPVLAWGRGGVLDTVVDGETGFLVEEQSVAAFAQAMDRAPRYAWDPWHLRRQAEAFRPELFRQRIQAAIADCLRGERQ